MRGCLPVLRHIVWQGVLGSGLFLPFKAGSCDAAIVGCPCRSLGIAVVDADSFVRPGCEGLLKGESCRADRRRASQAANGFDRHWVVTGKLCVGRRESLARGGGRPQEDLRGVRGLWWVVQHCVIFLSSVFTLWLP